MGWSEMWGDWRTDMAIGLFSAFVAFGGGVARWFPGWVTAGQGVVAGAFLTMAAMRIVYLNTAILTEVLPDDYEDV